MLLFADITTIEASLNLRIPGLKKYLSSKRAYKLY